MYTLVPPSYSLLHMRPELTLPKNRSRLSPNATSQLLLKLVHRFMRRFLKGFYHMIYGHGGHLGHVTWTIYAHIAHPPLPVDAS